MYKVSSNSKLTRTIPKSIGFFLAVFQLDRPPTNHQSKRTATVLLSKVVIVRRRRTRTRLRTSTRGMRTGTRIVKESEITRLLNIISNMMMMMVMMMIVMVMRMMIMMMVMGMIMR